MISDAAKDLIQRLLDTNPATRLSLTEAQAHIWLRYPIDEASKSYIDDYDSFLTKQNLNLKPKALS